MAAAQSPFYAVKEEIQESNKTDGSLNYSGLVVSKNKTIHAYLQSVLEDPSFSDELRQTASNLLLKSSIPYKSLRVLWVASPAATRPRLLHLFSGSDFVFSSPKPREKSVELKARLKKLEDLAERKAYKELVKDITLRKEPDEPFSSYKDQLGFGLHVALTMFTTYLVGYAAFRAMFNHSPVMNAAGGILGLVFGMFMETVLFIIRTSSLDNKSEFLTSKLKKNQ